MFRGEKVRLIVNEFGEEGIDGALLKDLDAALREICGGSVFCSCRSDQFEAALRECGKSKTILVETSGLADPTGVRRLFLETDRFPDIRYMGCICLADAVRFPKVFATARSCYRQLMAADVVVLNKIDRASSAQLEQTVQLIKENRPEVPVLQTTFGNIPDDFLGLLSDNQAGDQAGLPMVSDLSTRRMTLHISPDIPAEQLTDFIRLFAEETDRIKGIIQTRDTLLLVDCVGGTVSVQTAGEQLSGEKSNLLTVLTGRKTNLYSALKKACQQYADYVKQ